MACVFLGKKRKITHIFKIEKNLIARFHHFQNCVFENIFLPDEAYTPGDENNVIVI